MAEELTVLTLESTSPIMTERFLAMAFKAAVSSPSSSFRFRAMTWLRSPLATATVNSKLWRRGTLIPRATMRARTTPRTTAREEKRSTSQTARRIALRIWAFAASTSRLASAASCIVVSSMLWMGSLYLLMAAFPSWGVLS